MADKTIRVSQIYPCSPERIWNALTRPEEMRTWFFEQIKDFKAEIGFQTEFMVQTEDRLFPHVWKVIAIEPMRILGMDWSYRGYDGMGYVQFELKRVPEGTELSVTNTGLDSFTLDIPEFTEASCRAGWEFFLQDRLKEYVGVSKEEMA